MKITNLQPRIAMAPEPLQGKPIQGWSDDRRASRHERGYGTAWDKLRKRILGRDRGLCQCSECTKLGRIRIAKEVDHIVSKAEWMQLHGTMDGVDHEGNLQAINPDCHRRKTAEDLNRMQGRGGMYHVKRT